METEKIIGEVLTEREAIEQLKNAAAIALAILPELEQECAGLDERIASLRAVVAAHAAIAGKRPKRPTEGTTNPAIVYVYP